MPVDAPDELDREFVAQLSKGVPPPLDEANVRRWLTVYADALVRILSYSLQSLISFQDALYKYSERVDEDALYDACTHVRSQIAPFASKDWAASIIGRFSCFRASSSDDAFSVGKMLASRFRDRRNPSVSVRPAHSSREREVNEHPDTPPPMDQIDLTAPSVHEESPPPPPPSIPSPRIVQRRKTGHPDTPPPMDQIDLTAPSVHEESPPPPSIPSPRIVQRRKTGATLIKSPSPAARRARRPTIKATATPPPTRKTTRSTTKNGRIMPRPSPRVTNGPVPPKRLWAEHAPAGMKIYADFKNPDDFCTTCWNIGASLRCVFTHPNTCRRCQESVRGCHDHAAMLKDPVVSDEAFVPVPDKTKIPETTLKEQIDMIGNAKTRNRKRSSEQKDVDESDDEVVDELHKEVGTPDAHDGADDDTSRPTKPDDRQPPPVTSHTWAKHSPNVFNAEKIARGREILFPAVIPDDPACPVPPTCTYTVPAMFDEKTLYGTLMEQYEYYETKLRTCENTAAYLWAQLMKLRSGGMAALGVPTKSPREDSGRATRSSSLRGRGRARGSSSRGGCGSKPL
ncbi:hypothetical protein EIP86_011311 [Pleurotus ostreatoroseus]|nr:hypothetical protein EIP86_011311 [Pleurotus ostreatoroseus]